MEKCKEKREKAKKKRRWEKRMVRNILLGVNTFHLERGGRKRTHSCFVQVVGREAAHTPSRFNVFSSIPDATTRRGAH